MEMELVIVSLTQHRSNYDFLYLSSIFKDGKNNKTQSVEIQVEDVADSPPYFVAAFSVSLDEVDKIVSS